MQSPCQTLGFSSLPVSSPCGPNSGPLLAHLYRRKPMKPISIAKDQFGAQGADFIGVLGALLVRSAKDQLRAYLIDPTRLSGTLPLPPQKTSPGIGHTESAGDQATGVSPTRPAMGTLTSPPAAPPAALRPQRELGVATLGIGATAARKHPAAVARGSDRGATGHEVPRPSGARQRGAVRANGRRFRPAPLRHAPSRTTLCRLAGRLARGPRAHLGRAGTVFENAAAAAVRQTGRGGPGARTGDGGGHPASRRPAARIGKEQETQHAESGTTHRDSGTECEGRDQARDRTRTATLAPDCAQSAALKLQPGSGNPTGGESRTLPPTDPGSVGFLQGESRASP